MKKMNKKGGEEVLSLWWFLVFALIGVAIISGVIIYYSVIVDVRQIEADILADRIINCIVKDGNIKDFMQKNDFDFFSECGINKETKDYYYAKIIVYDSASCKIEEQSQKSEINCQNELKSFDVMKAKNFQDYCDLQKESRQNKLPQCVEKFVYVFDGGEARVLKITAASNQKSGEIWKS